jgi:hypothetical protein
VDPTQLAKKLPAWSGRRNAVISDE